MTDTLYADISSYQPDVDNNYPYRFIAIRSNDGTYRDTHFAKNLAWAKAACDAGRLDGFLVYFVFETNWLETVQTLEQMVGTPHPNMAVMIDVENWGGKIQGNHSVQINAARERLIGWLGGNRKRVIGYANAGDFAALWPNRGDARVVLANYSSNPSFPGKIAHQFSDRYNVPPFGACDINSADGLAPAEFAAALGLPVRRPSPTPKPTPNTPTPVTPTPAPAPALEADMYIVSVDKADAARLNVPWPGIFLVGCAGAMHITDSASLKAFLSLGIKAAKTPITVAQWRVLTGVTA